MKKRYILFLAIPLLIVIGVFAYKNNTTVTSYEVGQEIDSFNGVAVYYNGNVGNVEGRQLAPDGYNLGLKYQCVEFVKRYYYEALHHKMPNSYGHAKDFFIASIKDGKKNPQRNLTQFTNPSKSKPKVNDLVVYSGTRFNPYGHVSIISKVSDTNIEIIQQNPGPYASSRATYKLSRINGKWRINNDQILGWLRK
ncbi:CHAP domain-containing protein [uncultured Gelidibacter sp.]|uniref:CHAP domain-containing protein n=1 Tax=uncultured Gelidibacter sp. TaxID=259318 RepID=UPI00260D863E|nr:CHAP domain-containing protein [uncultured Gelidibacter sp.]